LDYNALLQSREETHAELARTIDELAQWLQIVETGFTTLLNHVDEGIIEEGSEDGDDLTTKPIPLNTISSTPPPPQPG